MNAALDAAVRQRAGGRCEYCRMPQSVRRLKFPIDHIIARKHGGGATLDNLALACGSCNLHKGSDIAGLDPHTGSLTRLFHPRRDRWDNHFRHNLEILVGTSAVGRTTVSLLQLNRLIDLPIRLELYQQGDWPGGTAAQPQ